MKKQREKWDRKDWLITIILCIVFLPIGLAALLRWTFYQRVWY